MNEIKHATVDAEFIKDLQTNLTVSWALYIIYTKAGDEISAACNITDARAAAATLSFIQMPCGQNALEVSMSDSRLMSVVEDLLKDGSFRAAFNYMRVTK